MTYKESINWLFNQLPLFQNIGAAAYKEDLTNILLLTEHLNHPERNFKTIHVAGTNGKGSTSSMIASVFMEAGYKVGLYTSPHLKDFRERITINGKKISKNYVHKFILNHKFFFEKRTDLLQLCIVVDSIKSAKNIKRGKSPFFILISKQK